MSDMEEQEEIDPIKIEVELLQELIEDNIIIVIHRNGVSIMMDEDQEERTVEQMRLFSRLYVASRPSFVLRFFLIAEVFLLLVWETLEDIFRSMFNKS